MKIKEKAQESKEWVESKFNKVHDFFYGNYHWARKSLEYAWFLRNDYDFDWSSIMKLLKYKISRSRKMIKENKIILRSEEVAAQMYHAECLIQKLLDDEFGEKEHEAHNKKWGIEYFPKHSDKWRIDNTKTPAEKAQMETELRAIMDLTRQQKEECKRELFDHLKNYIEEWWD